MRNGTFTARSISRSGGLLRVSESHALQRRHVSLPSDLRAHSQRKNKVDIAIVSFQTGPDQYVFASDPALVNMIVRMTSPFDDDHPIIKENPFEFNSNLKRLSEFFGFYSHPISSHSNRISGALHLFLNDIPFVDIAIRGHWGN